MTGAIIILLVFCGLAFYFIKKKKGAEKEDAGFKQRIPRSPTYAKDDLRIENVEAGGVIHLSGIGPDLEEFDVRILAKHLYRQGGSSWWELEGESPKGKVWIDLEEDDELELSISLKKLKLRDIALSKDDLDRIDDEEEGELAYRGEKYFYEDSDEATFYKYGNEANGERFYYWDFENDAGDKFIGVEKWSDGSFEAAYSEPIQSHQVTVYSLKK
ncbi:MAG: DUF4178 domain-containing protein [Nitrospiria bacterium]